MYVDVDVDVNENTNENIKDTKVLSCIRDVKFLCKNHFEQYNVGKPPFIMRHWVKNKLPTSSIKVSCIITYEVGFRLEGILKRFNYY